MMTTNPLPLRDRLLVPLHAGAVTLTPLTPAHRDALRAACAADSEIWQIYPTNYGPAAFDTSFDALMANRSRLPFAVLREESLVGMTAYLRIEESAQTLEIGNSYIMPEERGTALNGTMKRLMIDHAFASGIRRIEFRIDARNTRSQAAVRKIGAQPEGMLRAERITWTGHVRDTMLFSLLREDWESAPGR
ncbi:GNAT family N-acetyltransferase [Sphingobium lignivorans]|uniref:RimJ/RimL family protein N-acetyltransferase n=1 Tax=Sphingobium lignivorans TaxID=2735886 RepID=A0ABR6NCY6_9SPHN|nr:GNAT family protein [Sphingobium lignivorans]MBB5985130.1 RimJ/RimL family protein N-acetyltransferase [Sphingobium lignivorans]